MYRQDEFDYLLKILLVGSESVGKFSILRQYSESIFTKDGNSTIRVEFKIKKFEISNKLIKL